MNKYLKIARPDHWIKNLFIIPGVLVAILLTNIAFSYDLVFKLIIGFIATCFIASANYIINEWLDAEFDKYHPVKKNRPVVAGDMKVSYIIIEYIIFIILGLSLSILIGYKFLLVEIALLIMGIIYNVKPFRTKDIPYLDVLSESINNLLRFLLGWFIITTVYLPPLSISIGYWLAGAYLMGIKRFAEYRMIGDSSIAGRYRKSFEYYDETSLLISSIFYCICATFFIGVFMIKYRVSYIIGMPFVFYLFCLYLRIAFKPDSAVQKPEKLYTEKKLLIYIIFLIIIFTVLTIVNIPMPESWVKPMLLGV